MNRIGRYQPCAGLSVPIVTVLDRAWQVCRAGAAAMMDSCRVVMEEFREASVFVRGAKSYRPTIACIKAALCHLGVIPSDAVASGTPAMDADQPREYVQRFNEVRHAGVTLEPEWQSHWMRPRPVSARALQEA